MKVLSDVILYKYQFLLRCFLSGLHQFYRIQSRTWVLYGVPQYAVLGPWNINTNLGFFFLEKSQKLCSLLLSWPFLSRLTALAVSPLFISCWRSTFCDGSASDIMYICVTAICWLSFLETATFELYLVVIVPFFAMNSNLRLRYNNMLGFLETAILTLYLFGVQGIQICSLVWYSGFYLNKILNKIIYDLPTVNTILIINSRLNSDLGYRHADVSCRSWFLFILGVGQTGFLLCQREERIVMFVGHYHLLLFVTILVTSCSCEQCFFKKNLNIIWQKQT